jgi:hypothetical protein
MTQRSNIRRCGSQDRLTVPQMRGMLEMIQQNVRSEPEMCEFAERLQRAVEELDELRSVALAVMIEAETERAAFANPREDSAVKPC